MDVVKVETGNLDAAARLIAANGKHEPTMDELKARIAELEAKGTAGVTAKPRLTLGHKSKNETYVVTSGTNAGQKEQGKGTVSVYGLNRFPITLYGNQWEDLLDIADEVRAYLVKHKADISFDRNKR